MTITRLLSRRHLLPPGSLLALFLVAVPLVAQEETGKLEGSIHDTLGTPLASAQVYLVGTAYAAT
ncbi:MAG: hypothetical protein ABIQ49_12365, partial [Gemmatimonadales bacterium]